MSTDLRCDSDKLLGRLDEGLIELRCRSRWCGYRPGVVIIHRFSAVTGLLIDTKQYQNPSTTKGN